MKRRIELGMLYSRSGSYSLIAEACRSGALAGIAKVNASPELDISFVPIERDPGGNLDLYDPLCAEILRQSSARHVLGCVTSSSRKEVIPTLEKHQGTLWYCVPYEGFESSDHVAYTHACANQHLLPLLNWAKPRLGCRPYLTGSNYIWGWEINRLARSVIHAQGGEVLGERYLPVGSLEVDRMIEEIRATRPDYILNSLIGASQYRFLAAYKALGLEDPQFAPDACPVLSCNLTECEFPALGDAAEGLIAAGPYFRGATSWPNGGGSFGSSHEAAAFTAVQELARLLADRPESENESLAELLAARDGGSIDPATHHSTLPVLIAKVNAGRFQVLDHQPAIAGDPYLSRKMDIPAPRLRVVS